MTTYADLKTAQRAADIKGRTIQQMEEYFEQRTKELHYQIAKLEAQLEELQTSQAALETKKDLAIKMETK